MLTFLDAKQILAKYSGNGGACIDDPEVDLFTRKTLQFLLISSTNQDLRRFDFIASKGFFTVPDEVESIQKVKINERTANLWDKWFTYHNTNFLEGCVPCDNAIFEDPNYYATAYDPPSGGAQIGILGHCEEEADAYCIVQGTDVTGREIFTDHKGEQIAGEYLSIKKGRLNYTQVSFATITNVVLSKTKGYKTLYWVYPSNGKKGFLSDYTPLEERPTYRRYRLTSPDCGEFVRVSILARIRLKNAYADSDRIPFENLLTIETAGQLINANFNNDMQTATAKNSLMTDLIQKEQEHKRVQNGSPINFAMTTSPGRIRNIVGNSYNGSLWNWVGKR